MSMFRALALAQQRAVPVVRLRRMSGDSDIAAERGVAATGKRVYAAVVVRTTRKERRGLERAR